MSWVKIYWIIKCTPTVYILPLFSSPQKTVLIKFFNDPIDFHRVLNKRRIYKYVERKLYIKYFFELKTKSNHKEWG